MSTYSTHKVSFKATIIAGEALIGPSMMEQAREAIGAAGCKATIKDVKTKKVNPGDPTPGQEIEYDAVATYEMPTKASIQFILTKAGAMMVGHDVGATLTPRIHSEYSKTASENREWLFSVGNEEFDADSMQSYVFLTREDFTMVFNYVQ